MRRKWMRRWSAFHAWAAVVCGITFKFLKDRLAARKQLMLGFGWDSISLTRTLDSGKLRAYLAEFEAVLTTRSMSLRRMQSVAGKLQRAVMTLPPGAACFLTSMFRLMAGLTLPWYLRKVSRDVRRDVESVLRLLELNLGVGYYSFANFSVALLVYSDASRCHHSAGGGYVSACGMYNWWPYRPRAARKPIAFLEGDTIAHGL
ncbi:MAG: hypothetical protein SGPRY_011495, partial [Prymnesium sp.]